MNYLFFLFFLVWGVPALSHGGLSAEITGAGLEGLPTGDVEVTTLFHKVTTEAFGKMLDSNKERKEIKTIVVRGTKTLTQIMAQSLTSKDKQLGKAALLESSRK